MQPTDTMDRRQLGRLAAGALMAGTFGGCSGNSAGRSEPDLVWGKLGAGDGQFSKPRAMAIDAQDQL